MQKSPTKKRTKHKINLAKVTGWTMIGLSVALVHQTDTTFSFLIFLFTRLLSYSYLIKSKQ